MQKDPGGKREKIVKLQFDKFFSIFKLQIKAKNS